MFLSIGFSDKTIRDAQNRHPGNRDDRIGPDLDTQSGPGRPGTALYWLAMLTSLDLADRLRVAVGRLARRLRQQSLGGLTPSQASVLATLDKHGEMSMSRVAELESITRPSATGIVGRLEGKGLVARSPNPDDLRSALVALTPRARKLLDERRQLRTAYLANRLDELTADERDVLHQAVGILERINQGQ